MALGRALTHDLHDAPERVGEVVWKTTMAEPPEVRGRLILTGPGTFNNKVLHSETMKVLAEWGIEATTTKDAINIHIPTRVYNAYAIAVEKMGVPDAPEKLG